jgi:hypothetical protein
MRFLWGRDWRSVRGRVFHGKCYFQIVRISRASYLNNIIQRSSAGHRNVQNGDKYNLIRRVLRYIPDGGRESLKRRTLTSIPYDGSRETVSETSDTNISSWWWKTESLKCWKLTSIPDDWRQGQSLKRQKLASIPDDGDRESLKRRTLTSIPDDGDRVSETSDTNINPWWLRQSLKRRILTSIPYDRSRETVSETSGTNINP